MIWATAVDAHASVLASRWASRDAAVLTAADLSQPGWVCSLQAEARSRAVIGGRKIDTQMIEGVFVRWPRVFAQELRYIRAEDRAYVASEMTAFMSFWLTHLPCRVVNRPAPANLLGLDWGVGRWLATAAALDIPVQALEMRVEIGRPPEVASHSREMHVVTVVGGRCFGAVGGGRGEQSRALAAAAGIDVAAFHFEPSVPNARFCNVDLMPELSEEAADAALALLSA